MPIIESWIQCEYSASSMPYNIFMLLGYRRMWWNNPYYCLSINILAFPGDINEKPDSPGRESGQGLHAGKSRLCRWIVHAGL